MPPLFGYFRPSRGACTVLLLLAAFIHATPVRAQTPTQYTKIEEGRAALQAGNYDRAVELLGQAVRGENDDGEVHYLLAQAFLATNRLKAARKEIRKARTSDPENIKFAVTEVEILRASTPAESSISLTDGRRATLANSILRRDPGNPAALEELALHHATSYRWFANFDATKQPLGDGVARRAREEFDVASDLLRRSIASDPTRMSAYGELLKLFIEEGQWSEATELATDASRAVPSSATAWLLRGLVAQLQNRSEEAMPFFEEAIRRMSPEVQTSFGDISLFLSASEQAAYRVDPKGYAANYWAERDPYMLTNVNERLVDHYARMAYCDLWYGGASTPGWETERGRIVMRYGIPWGDASFIGGFSRFNVLAFQDFEFVFEDITRGGHYTMYSPKAGAASSWTNDYVIQAGEMAISNPEQYDPKLVAPIDPLVETSAFRGESGKTDLYVHILIPAALEPFDGRPDGVVGAFLVGEDGKIVDRGVGSLNGMRAHEIPSGIQWTEGLQSDPGSYRLNVEYLSDDRSSAGRAEFVSEVPAFGTDSLTVSDLLPASAVDEPGENASPAGDRIIRSGYVIQPMPWAHVQAGSDLLVYFEMYALQLDSSGQGSYRINARVEGTTPKSPLRRFLSRVFGGGKDIGVEASIASTSQRSDESRVVSIGLPKTLSPGIYRFVLEVTDLHTGRMIRRTHSLNVSRPSGH